MLESTIRQIFTPQVVGVAPDEIVGNALELMRRKRVSCLVALDGGRPAGVFTERSVVRASAAHGRAFTALPIREVMTSPVVTVTSDTQVYEAYNILAQRRIRHLVVVDGDGRAEGVVTLSNMISNLGVEYFVEVKRIVQIMTRGVVTVRPGVTVAEALGRMAGDSLSCVLVEEERRPVGIITERDVARLILYDGDPDATPVEAVMTRPVLTVASDTSVHQAATIMRERDVRRLVVVDQRGEIGGLITQTDIVRGLEGKYVEILRRVITEKNVRLAEAETEAAVKSAYLENILRSSFDMAIVATDIDFRIIYFNEFAESVLGCRASEVSGRDVTESLCRAGVDLSRIRRAIGSIRRDRLHEFSFEMDSSRGPRFIDARVSGIWDRSESLVGYVLMFRDVTERREAEETIRRLAYHDSLTGLPNRLLFADRLRQALVTARRNRRILAVMLLDLDEFKQVNDTLGHSAGDELLVTVSGRIAGLLRKSDTVARMGGDEFLILLPEITSPEGAAVVAGKILEAVRRPYTIGGAEVRVSTSIGIAVYPKDGEDIDTLVKRADSAMYKAKDGGRDGWAWA